MKTNIDKMAAINELGSDIYGKVMLSVKHYAEFVVKNPNINLGIISPEAWAGVAEHVITLPIDDFKVLEDAMNFGEGYGGLYQVFITSVTDSILHDEPFFMFRIGLTEDDVAQASTAFRAGNYESDVE